MTRNFILRFASKGLAVRALALIVTLRIVNAKHQRRESGVFLADASGYDDPLLASCDTL